MKKILSFIAVLMLATNIQAGVNLKNGNFYISYTDIIVPGGGHDLEVVRTYNSRATQKGWFGVGWGSDFETNLKVGADGSVVIHENGAGAKTRFTPRESVNAKAAATKIVAKIRKKGSLSESVANNLITKLTKNSDLRQAYAAKFDVKAKLASGTVLYSNTRGLQELKKEKVGYVRSYTTGKKQYFNEKGQLINIVDKNGYKLKLTYKNNHLDYIKDSQAKQLFFSWYPDGKVKAIWSAGDKKTNYTYSENNLATSTDVGGNKYIYSFDSNHNLTSVKYKDNSKMTIAYEKKTQFAKKVTSRYGADTFYKYDSNPKNPDHHYWTVVGRKNSKGKLVNNRYEYETKVRPDGSEYTYRILTKINDLKTETIYSECCSLPLKITRGKSVTNFEYNKDGLLTKKSSTKGEFVQLEYNKKHKKISRVVNDQGWTNFEYDKKGNLNKAVSSKGKSVLLIYDRKGRITKMIDYNKKSKKKRSLAFKYNALGKPVEIAMSKVGTINVAYDNYGEIKKVESKSGNKMALQVTQAFQSLLTIVKPAGVNLNL